MWSAGGQFCSLEQGETLPNDPMRIAIRQMRTEMPHFHKANISEILRAGPRGDALFRLSSGFACRSGIGPPSPLPRSGCPLRPGAGGTRWSQEENGMS